MSESESVKQTLAVLRSAKGVQDIGGRERLADAQNYIVDLMSYLEASDGYSLFAGERRKCGASKSSARVADQTARPGVLVEPRGRVGLNP